MEWGQEEIGIRVGYASHNDCRVLIVSLYPDAIELECNNVLYMINMTPVGMDNPAISQACFTGVVMISGLTANTSYNFKVQQKNNIATGSLRTLPDSDSDYSLFFTSCDNLDANASPTGFYSYIKRYCETGDLPVVAVVHVDDLVYADRVEIDDTDFTGHKSNERPVTVYDRCLCYMAYFGLFGNRANKQTRIGHSPDRKWVYRNTNLWPQWGDHEFIDNIGWVSFASEDPSWLPGTEVWDAFYGQLSPPRLRGDDHSDAQHWGVSLGALYVGSLDRITKGEGGRDSGRVLFGEDQINDMLASFNGNEPFKILNINNSIRYMMEGDANSVIRGANEPVADERPDEYASLFTNVGAMQDMSNNNGFKFLTIHGDHHNPGVHVNRNNDGAIQELFCDIVVGTCNGSQNHTIDPDLNIGKNYNGSEILYMDRSRSSSTFYWSGARVDVYSSVSPKELHVTLIDRREKEVWKGVWREDSSSNLPEIIAPTSTMPNYK